MSNDKSTTVSIFGGLPFVAFVSGKVAGVIFVNWSWWWIVFPSIPCVGEILIWLVRG